MLVSDISVKRPVLAAVISLLLVAFGLVALNKLSLREYPNIDPPIVTISTVYEGASASVIEHRITSLIEDQIAGIEGIKYIESSSMDGRSTIKIEFEVERDIDAAANDVRDRIARVVRNLPLDIEPPEIQKVDGNEDIIMWFNLNSDTMTIPELTDYAEHNLSEKFSVLEGVARVRIGGGQEYAMRIWLDADAMAARGITAGDIEKTLLQTNVELPAGQVIMQDTMFSVRMDKRLLEPEDFANLVIKLGDNLNIVRLQDVARVELGAVENRLVFRGNGLPQVGIGIVKQATANTLSVARVAKAEAERLNQVLPEGMSIALSYDSSVFVESSVNEVLKTLVIATLLVMLVILAFLRSFRVAIIPLVTVPVSIIATFLVLWWLGFSINILTLLALVLAIGLVVDDAIVVLENVQRHVEKGYSPLSAAFVGTRQVGFAVIATTLVLVAVFVPISFLEGNLGRLLSEFAITLAVAVLFSAWAALTLAPALASKLLKPNLAAKQLNFSEQTTDKADAGQNFWVKHYQPGLVAVLKMPWLVALVILVFVASSYYFVKQIPQEYAPPEDRGTFFVLITGPEGASHDYMNKYLDEIEARIEPLVEKGEVRRLISRSPGTFGGGNIYNSARVVVVLEPWGERRPANIIMQEVRKSLEDLPGVNAFTVMRQGLGGRVQKPVQFVIGGGTYQQLAQWRDILFAEVAKDNPGFIGLDSDFKETKPQLKLEIDYEKAADLGVKVLEVGRSLQTLLGSLKVTTFNARGEEYDIILEAERGTYNSPKTLDNIYVRSETTQELIPLSSLVSLTEFADSGTLNRYNRMRAITLEANLAEGYTLGEALNHLENLAKTHLPAEAMIDYKGQSRDFKNAGGSIVFVILLGLLVVFLVMAAQFESFMSPFIIMFTVPLAVAGGLWGLWLHGLSLNIYTEIALIILIGIATKNGILIVEFANQLRDQGLAIREAVIEAASLRLRPIIMTAVTTIAGAMPLVLSFGAGAETRFVMGVVIIWGVALATFFTLFVIPVVYQWIGKYSSTPGVIKQRLEKELGA